VITTASTIPVEVGDNYLDAFSKLNCKNVSVMHIRNRDDARFSLNILQRIKAADAVMMTGGNQMRLTATFGGTEISRMPYMSAISMKKALLSPVPAPGLWP
jgi:cyanophycinase